MKVLHFLCHTLSHRLEALEFPGKRGLEREEVSDGRGF